MGLRILRELGHPYVDGDGLWAPIEPLVVQLALSDDVAEVVRWAISCLGCQAESPTALAAVLRRVDHDDGGVRFAVAAALPHLTSSGEPDGHVVQALLALADDEAADVRSYAIMGLAGDLGLAGSIEPQLRAHLADPDEQIRTYCQGVLDGDWS
ncbi:HEAT repeat domain-containing protein [Aquihabitans sp. G128]|uniref:HEAT repeat domain-containing protein n=1 Tax=Aquihabitans sp. G128 TaxID=2849779 RepID=UPI001C241FFD|nr:HEAT repeat domain-containing protein [Aquihabitans sp. G128]QXC61070.1 HEAT repeat domain-containing protein [Aquihabitans sp. G128]